MADRPCQLCEREITDEQECTVLICAAHGETICHTSHTHDKCWERFKKQFVRGRAGNRSSTTFFCPVQGCHNALQGQHTAVRKVEPKVECAQHHDDGEGGGGAAVNEGRHLSAAERHKRDQELGLLEEVEEGAEDEESPLSHPRWRRGHE